MNYTKLVNLIKNLVTESQHHSSRYGGSISGSSDLSKRGIPNKIPQLAENDVDKKLNKKKKFSNFKRKSETGSQSNEIIINPDLNSQIEPTRGAQVKSPLDTKY